MPSVRLGSVSETEKVDQVRALQRVLYRSAKQDPHRRFHALFDKVARSDILWRAWVEVAKNGGAPGVDGVTITSIEEGDATGCEMFLDRLAQRLRDKTYRPKPLRRVHIPKPGKPGQTRPLGIPTVADRVVMTAAKIVLEPIFEADFSPVSFGFRPKRSAHQALEAIRVAANRGANWVLDADIKACFDEIDHDALMGQVERRVVDRQMLKLLRSWLRAGVFEGGWSPTPSREPRRAHPSPRCWPTSPSTSSTRPGRRRPIWGRWSGMRTTSLSSPPAGAEPKRRSAGSRRCWSDSGCSLHPDKTRIVNLAGGKEGFDFLGFHHRKTPSRFGGRRYLSKWPSDRAMASIRTKIRERTDSPSRQP